jgi:hypothetical protein
MVVTVLNSILSDFQDNQHSRSVVMTKTNCLMGMQLLATGLLKLDRLDKFHRSDHFLDLFGIEPTIFCEVVNFLLANDY